MSSQREVFEGEGIEEFERVGKETFSEESPQVSGKNLITEGKLAQVLQGDLSGVSSNDLENMIKALDAVRLSYDTVIKWIHEKKYLSKITKKELFLAVKTLKALKKYCQLQNKIRDKLHDYFAANPKFNTYGAQVFIVNGEAVVAAYRFNEGMNKEAPDARLGKVIANYLKTELKALAAGWKASLGAVAGPKNLKLGIIEYTWEGR